MFTVCSKYQVSAYVIKHAATHLITMLDPDDSIQRPGSIAAENHLELHFEDYDDDLFSNGPTIENCQQILDFGKKLPDDAVTVVHCFAGVSRSTAAALALYVQQNGMSQLAEAQRWLAADRPIAMPNMLMAGYFDKLLECNGKFIKLCQDVNSYRVPGGIIYTTD